MAFLGVFGGLGFVLEGPGGFRIADNGADMPIEVLVSR